MVGFVCSGSFHSNYIQGSNMYITRIQRDFKTLYEVIIIKDGKKSQTETSHQRVSSTENHGRLPWN